MSGLTRNALSQLTEIQRYSNLAGTNLVADTTYGYDNDSRLTTLSNALGSTGSTVLNNSMSYDADSQLTTLTTPDGTSTLTYDHDGQLTSASLTSEAYTYDANGNRTGTGITTTANNQLQTEGAYDYAYDANGNLITQTTNATGATENFTWDDRNRLTGIVYKNGSGTVTGGIAYTYDPLTNNRISMTQEDGSGDIIAQEYYVYDGSNLLMVLDGSGNVKERYLTGNNANQVLATETGISGSSAGTTSWDLTDYQGSTTDVINNSGSVLDHIKYTTYGTILTQTGPTYQPRFTYTGMQLDTATGLLYDHARYYNSSTGTFISQDPSGFAGGSTDLYAYVNDDPTNMIDPTGLTQLKPGGGNGGMPRTQGYGKGTGGYNPRTGGYESSQEQLDSSWWSNFWGDLFDQNAYGATGENTPMTGGWQTAETISQDTAIVALSFAGGIAAGGVAAAALGAEGASLANAFIINAVSGAVTSGGINAGVQLTGNQPFSWSSLAISATSGGLAGGVTGVVLQGLGILSDSNFLNNIGGGGPQLQLAGGGDGGAGLSSWLAGTIQGSSGLSGTISGGISGAVYSTGSGAGNGTSNSNPYLDGQTPMPGTRNTGVNRAIALEVQLVQETGAGTLDWTPSEIKYIQQTGELPDGIVGHHINNVADYPEWAGDPRNIEFVRGQTGNLDAHGGNFQNSTTGPLIDRAAMVLKATGGE